MKLIFNVESTLIQRWINVEVNLQIKPFFNVEDGSGWGSTLNQRWFNVEPQLCARWEGLSLVDTQGKTKTLVFMVSSSIIFGLKVSSWTLYITTKTKP